jgi:ABC-type transporter Mla maintaining outer membrane lipid asymmetry ATPase subunit MlaF
MWRGRSEAHAAATVGLLNMAHSMKDKFVQMKTERDELEKQYNMLKKRIEHSKYGYVFFSSALFNILTVLDAVIIPDPMGIN